MSKNALYGIIAIVVIVIIVGAALAVYYNKPSETHGPSVKNPDTFMWDEQGDPQTLDPAECYGVVGSSIIYNVYETLVTYKGKDTENVHPLLATDWEVDSSGKVWTFHLRKNVTFSNGDPFNAEAVKFSFDRVLIMNSPQTGVSWILSQFMYPYNTSSGQWDSPDGESSVRIIDDYTVQFKLSKPYGGFLAALSHTVASIVDPKYVNEHGGVTPNEDNEWMSEHMMGTGPYKLVEWKHNQYIKLEWNPNYWGGWEGKHVKYIIRRNVAEISTRVQEILKGDADMANIPCDHISEVEGKEGIVVEKGGLTYNVEMIEMNCRPVYQGKPNPLHSKLVRQAISYAINYQAIIDQVFMGYAIQMQGPIPKGMPGHDDNLFMYSYNPQKAKELLAEAGYPNGFSVDILAYATYPEYVKIAQIVKENLADVGIAAEVQTLARPTVLDKMDRGDYQMLVLGWAPDYNDPDCYIFPFLASAEIDGDTYHTGWHNDTFDELVLKAKYEVDPEKRAQLYKQAQEIAMEDPSLIYLVQRKSVVVYRSWLHGFEYNPIRDRCPSFYDLYKE